MISFHRIANLVCSASVITVFSFAPSTGNAFLTIQSAIEYQSSKDARTRTLLESYIGGIMEGIWAQQADDKNKCFIRQQDFQTDELTKIGERLITRIRRDERFLNNSEFRQMPLAMALLLELKEMYKCDKDPAAEQGDAQAQHNLDEMQDHGEGASSDIELMQQNSPLMFAIIAAVGSPDGRLDKATHDQFWALFPASVRDHPKGFTEKLQTLKNVAFQKELWESIRLSARAKRVVKTISYSSARAEALQNDPAGQDKGKRADKLIVAAARGKPYKGILGTLSVSEERANQVLDGLNGTYERLQRLLDPVWREQ